MLLNNILAAIGAVLLLGAKYANSFEMLIAGRLVIGINSGINAGISPMYLTEICPTSLRGAVSFILFVKIRFFFYYFIRDGIQIILAYVVGPKKHLPKCNGLNKIKYFLQIREKHQSSKLVDSFFAFCYLISFFLQLNTSLINKSS